eukprot:m.43658 g.43658  ORF g.43658 m.43658 type:complete len:423 (+) comp12946_c0_seq1:90-1358(+)
MAARAATEFEIAIVGGGIAGLACGIALKKLGRSVIVFDKVKEMKDAGSGMSVIGHSLIILEALGVDMRNIGLKQTDVSLRRHNDTLAFRVPLQSDAELVGRFGSVQYNVHRGELQQSLMSAFLACGGDLRTGSRYVSHADNGDYVTFTLDNGAKHTCRLLIGADGAHSRVRHVMHPGHKLRYSGFSCWRGITSSIPKSTIEKHNHRMLKTIIHQLNDDVSFTSGYTTHNRCFWVLDVKYPQGLYLPGPAGKAYVASRMGLLSKDFKTIVEVTPGDNVLQTDVFDSNPFRCHRNGRVVLIGDAAHPVVHHFGQGACLAIEDAVRLVQCLHEHGKSSSWLSSHHVAASLASHDSWLARLRAWTLMYISRWCGDMYMSNGAWRNCLLEVCLAWPMNLLFAGLMRILLFWAQRGLRQFADKVLARS